MHLEECQSLSRLIVDVVRRPALLMLLGYDLDGQPWQWALQGFKVIFAQHELDHLEGIITFHQL